LNANGWSMEGLPRVNSRDLAGYRFNGVIDSIEPDKFGPAAN
jgi:hypothetical protein